MPGSWFALHPSPQEPAVDRRTGQAGSGVTWSGTEGSVRRRSDGRESPPVADTTWKPASDIAGGPVGNLATGVALAAASGVLLLAGGLCWRAARVNADIVRRVLALTEAPGIRHPGLVRLAALLAGGTARARGARPHARQATQVPMGRAIPHFPIPSWAFWCALRSSRTSLPRNREGMCRRAAALVLAAYETQRALESEGESDTTRNRLNVFGSVQFKGLDWRIHRREGSALALVSCAGNLWWLDCSRVSGVAALAGALEAACSREPGNGILALASAGTIEGYVSVRSSMAPIAGEALRTVDRAICVVSLEPSASPDSLHQLSRLLRAWAFPSRLYTAGMLICAFGNAEVGVIHHHFGIAGMPAAIVDGMVFRRSERILAAADGDPAPEDRGTPRLVPLEFPPAPGPPSTVPQSPLTRASLPERDSQTHTWHCDVFVRATAARHGLSLHPLLAIATQLACHRLFGRFFFFDAVAQDDGDFVTAPACTRSVRELLDTIAYLDAFEVASPEGQMGSSERGLLAGHASLLRRACRSIEDEIQAIRSGQGAFHMIRRRLAPCFRAVCLGLLTLEPVTHEKVDLSDIGRRIGLIAFGPAMFGWPRRARAAVRFCDGEGFVAVDLLLSPTSGILASDFRQRFEQALAILRRILEADRALRGSSGRA